MTSVATIYVTVYCDISQLVVILMHYCLEPHRCVTPTGQRNDVVITIPDDCGRDYTKCKDGACIPESQLCDGTAQCRDGSDENPLFCKGYFLIPFVHFAKLVLMLIINLDLSSTLEIVPSRVTALPWRPFKFTCVSSTAERPSVILLRDRKPIELDPRFSVKRYRDNSIEVSAPHGLASLGPDETLVYVSTRFGFYFPTLFL